MSFKNNFNTEASGGDFWDGGVLEVSINGGSYTDILAAGGGFTSGGYTGLLYSGGDDNNPLAGRMAWSGDLAGYIDTVVNLGPSVVGQTIVLRFRMGTDATATGPGWNIDDISLTGTCPVDFAPTVTTQPVTGIGTAAATGNGNVTDLGNPDPTEHGVVWSTFANPTTADNLTTDGAVVATGPFVSAYHRSCLRHALSRSRAYATNTTRTVYGDDVEFDSDTVLSVTGPASITYLTPTITGVWRPQRRFALVCPGKRRLHGGFRRRPYHDHRRKRQPLRGKRNKGCRRCLCLADLG